MATLGRCTAASVTPTGGSAITVADPVSLSVVRDNELIEKQYSNKRQAAYFRGKTVKGVTLVCADLAVYNALKKGTRISAFSATVQSALNTDGTNESGNNGVTVALVTSAIVTEAVPFESSTDGSPAEYSITIMLCRNDSGTPGSMTIDGVTV